MHLVITGASSFIGRHIVADLVAKGHDVTALYRKGGAPIDALARIPGKLRLVQLDIADRKGWSALPSRVDAVIHIAGVSITADVSVDEMLACNIDGTRNLILYATAAKAELAIYASSLSVHGRVESSEVDERTPVRDPDIYGASKFLAERLFAATSLPTVALRLPGVIGPGAHRAWIPTVFQQIRNNADITIFNPEASFNNAVHVRDLQAFLRLLIERRWQGFHAFPIGAADCITVRQVVDRLIANSGSKSKVHVVQDPRQSFRIRTGCAERHFGYRPSPITAMLDWYVDESSSENPHRLLV